MNLAESEAWLGLMRVCELLPAALDAQLQATAQMTHFEFLVLSTLQLAPEKVMRMTRVAEATNSTLPRLSHVATRMAAKGLIERTPCPSDKRATNLSITSAGRGALMHAIPGHIAQARELVIDALTAEQLEQLAAITFALDTRLAAERHTRLGNAGLPSERHPL
ncbi:MAG: MarR family transcriptional regulator [Demequinaceae bacterium]|nr:MarR family transcriptional regulator [Demequinaceae bacterium]